jgi:hypothetical protein
MEGNLLGLDLYSVLRAIPLVVALFALIYFTIINRERPRRH